jgi:hypothetical protein
MIPKNIYFYWDKDIPEEVTNNIINYQNNNLDYNVRILNDNDINKYKDSFPELVNLFHLSTIAALKSDIIRFIFLYEDGGIWIDSNTTLVNNNGINILFERYKEFDFVITILPNTRNDLKTSALISKQKSKLAYDTIQVMTKNLLNHYNLELKSDSYIPYNYFYFIAPVVFFDLLEYHYDNEFRTNGINLITIKDDNNNILTLNSKKFKEYNCGLMDVKNILQFYGCNMIHHHGKNFDKHWSNLQKSQKLFSN